MLGHYAKRNGITAWHKALLHIEAGVSNCQDVSL